MENITDRIAVIFGGSAGIIFANLNIIQDVALKFACTVVFAAIGAIVAFYVKRGLEKKYKQKND
jgi:hypothetical protein